MNQAPDGAAVVLFDGVCNLCNSTVRWIIAHDRRGTFRFASLQSHAARRILESAGVADLPDSVALVENGRVRTRSDAAITIARLLGFPWSLAAILVLLPRPPRDAIYDRVARNRYRWFGRQNACSIPTPELRARFLDADEPVAERAELRSAPPAPALADPRQGARTNLTDAAARSTSTR